VPHATRWSLSLPGAQAVRSELQASLHDTLALLDGSQDSDQNLYFFRLALFHEDMHTEAATYMAQTLGFDPFSTGALPHPAPLLGAPRTLHLPATSWPLGRNGPGFDFDNERGASLQAIPELAIDSQPVNWAQYLPFVESGASAERRHWSEAGWAWRQAQASAAPRYLRPTNSGWEQQRFGQWQRLDLNASACHLTAFEAQAWCHWAHRRLPTEAEWEATALTLQAFQWGTVWEWTASAFAPFPGFEPHPYRDYSAPWFDGRPVLKGASPATAPRMRHARYRNFFPPDRNDVMTGFRSVALPDAG
jgi:ergothioneine biosynthesis protein EgtB